MKDTIVDLSDDRLMLKDGEESASFDDDVVHNLHHEIETKGMWRKMVRAPDGYVSKVAMKFAAEHLGLDGGMVVREDKDKDGLLVPCDLEGKELADTGVNLALYDRCGHFKAWFHGA